MSKPADLNRCLAALDQDHTIIAVIEMSQSSWLVAGVVPGIARHPLKKLAPDQDALPQNPRPAPGPPPQAPPRLAGGARPSRPRDQPHCCRLRGRPRRLLVGPLAA